MSKWRLKTAENGTVWVHYEAGGNHIATPGDVWAGERIAELEAALVTMANGRKPCPSGTQRVSRDEMKDIARVLCLKFGLDWSK